MTSTLNRISVILTIAFTLAICSLAPSQADVVLGDNLISNPGFDANTAGWSLGSSASRDTSVSRSGSASVKLNPASNPAGASANLATFAGRYVQLSAWTKTAGADPNAGGAVLEIKCLNSASKPIGAVRSQPVATDGHWAQVQLSARVPLNAASMQVALLNTSPASHAWFDDVSCVFPNETLFRTMLRQPSYRQTIFAGQSTNIIVGAEVFASDSSPASALSVKAELLDNRQEVLVATLPKGVINKSWQNLGLSVPPNQTGEMTVRVSLLNSDNQKVLQKSEHKLNVTLLPLPKVSFDSANRCIVDGKPFFPIGIYTNNAAAEDLQNLQSWGFNTVLDRGMLSKSLAEQSEFFAALENHSLMGIFDLSDCYKPLNAEQTHQNWGNWTGASNVIEGLVQQYKSAPSLLAWYINHSRSGDYLPQIASAYSQVKKLDSEHPCLQIIEGMQDYRAHVAVSDVGGLSCFPVWMRYADKTGSVYMPIFGSQTEVAYKAGMYSRPVWMVAEAAKFQQTQSATNPTAAQILCEAYQAIINGARGLMLADLTNAKLSGESQTGALQSVAQNLKAITPIALGDDVPADEKVTTTNPNIECITRSTGDDVYILAANTSQSTINASFNVPQKLANAKGHAVEIGPPGSTTKTIQLAANTLSDSIPANGTKVYRLKKTLTDLLVDSPKPNYKKGHTLPRLMRWGYGIPLDLDLEFVRNWNYALGIGTEDVQISGLDNPNSQWYKLAKIANDDPETYPAYIYTRYYAYASEKESFPEDIWCHTAYPAAVDNRIVKKDGFLIYNPLASDDTYKNIANKWAQGIKILFSKFPNICAPLMVNGGEWGIGVIAGDGEYWKKDPKVIAAVPGGVNASREQWFDFISQNKARATKILMETFLDAIPGDNTGIYYATSGANLRTYNEPWNWTAWSWDHKHMRSVSGNDLAVMEAYYGTQFTWTGKDNLLNTVLNMVAQQIDNGNPLSYNFVDGGRPNIKGSLDKYYGALKCYFTAGMIGGVAYYNGVTPDESLVQQMIALSYVQALFSHLEEYLRNGTLLPGPNMHVRSIDLPAYEFPSSDSSMRVLARKLNEYDNWLVTAWAADGPARDATVDIPELGAVTIEGRPEGSVYTVWVENGIVKTRLMDRDGMQPSVDVPEIMLATSSPVFSPPAGSYGSSRNITITCPTPGATIYYTTDGSIPTTKSKKYTSPITVSSTTIISAIAVKPECLNSRLVKSEYRIGPSLPFKNLVASWDFAIQGKNLLEPEASNGGEAGSVSPWNGALGSSTVISSSNEEARQGKHSIKVEVGNETGGVIFKSIAVLGSATYSISFWIYGPKQEYKVTWTASNNAGVSRKHTVHPFTKTTSDWEKIVVENQTMANDVSISGFQISTSSGTVFFIDEVQLEKSNRCSVWEEGVGIQYYPPQNDTSYALMRGTTPEPYGWFQDPVISPTGTIFDGKVDMCTSPVGWWNSVFKTGYHDGIKRNSSTGESFVITAMPDKLPESGAKAYLFDNIINGTSSPDASTSGFAAWINSDGTVTVAARSKGTEPEDVTQMHTSKTIIAEPGKWVTIGASVSFATDGTGKISIYKNGMLIDNSDQSKNKTFGSPVYVRGRVTPHSPGFMDTVGKASDRTSPFCGHILYLSFYSDAKSQVEQSEAHQYYKMKAKRDCAVAIP